MARPSKYPRELRERAVRMVAEVAPQYGSEYEAIREVAAKLGIGTEEPLIACHDCGRGDHGRQPRKGTPR